MAGALAGATGGSASGCLAPAFDSFLLAAKVPATTRTANNAMIHALFMSCTLHGILESDAIAPHLGPNP